MTEENEDIGSENVDPSVAVDELTTLKSRADLMGITYHPSIGVKKLKEKIDTKLTDSGSVVNPVPKAKGDYLTHSEFIRIQTKDKKRRAGNLVRIRVTCMNPDKKGWEGEIISVGSAKLGTYKKYVLFNAKDGWHVPNIIYEAMKDRKCSVFTTVKDHLGNKVRKVRMENEFNIEVLPPLTKEELKELAQRQALIGSGIEE